MITTAVCSQTGSRASVAATAASLAASTPETTPAQAADALPARDRPPQPPPQWQPNNRNAAQVWGDRSPGAKPPQTAPQPPAAAISRVSEAPPAPATTSSSRAKIMAPEQP